MASGSWGFSGSVLSHRANKKHIESMLGFFGAKFKGMSWEIGSCKTMKQKDWLTNARNYHSSRRHVKFLKEIQGVHLFSDPQILPEQNVPRRERFGCCTWFRITFHNAMTMCHAYLNRPPVLRQQIIHPKPVTPGLLVTWLLGVEFLGWEMFLEDHRTCKW